MGEDEFGSIFLRIRRTQASTLRDKLQVSPDRVQQCVPGEGLSLMTCHVVDEAELQGGGSDFLAAHRDSHGRRVDEDIAAFAGRQVMVSSRQRFGLSGAFSLPAFCPLPYGCLHV